MFSGSRGRLAAAALLIGAGAIASFIAFGQATPAYSSYKATALSSDPLYATASGDKPTLALALSVEYPTVGAQYLRDDGGTDNTQDPSYANTKEYLGYYDAESCYVYNDAPTETPATGLSKTDYKRFDRSGPATNRMCGDAFSGNFLNWASNSAIDMLRLALSGGDRYIDTSTLTILQRAVIPNGDPVCMWNSQNFPAKQLQKNGGGTGKYWGAVPAKMITAANGGDIWIANTLNGIYFGTAKGGSCSDTSSYKLAGSTPAWVGTITNSSNSLPSDATQCAAENGTCTFSGGPVKEVWYGANKSWKVAPITSGVSCSNGIFGDPLNGTAKQCYVRTYSGTQSPPSSSTALNSDGFFYARVSVCSSDTSGSVLDNRDYGLCTRYANGNYKPTGVIQKYSEQMRLAAFGYLLDQTASYNNGRYGGVLRAPMKYVGQKTFDVYGQENTPATGNANVEWNPTTGVYYANPDNDSTQTPAISGVINYLNKFGRTGVAGRYKIYDPVGELYYETLRYLQGLQPSDAAISGVTMSTQAGAALYDGFPVYTSWTNLDPYDGRSTTGNYACLKSNIVVIGDVNTHDGNRFPTASAANNIVDINGWTGTVRNFEKNVASTYVDGQNTSRQTGNPNGANNSVPTDSKTSAIMGAAYWAHTHDIRGTTWTGAPAKQRPGLRVKTFTFDVNEYGNSTSASYRRYQNQFFMAAKYGGFEADPANPNKRPYNTYGNPFLQQDGTANNNVWQSQTQPGEAASYYLQSNARGVLAAFDDIFSKASSSARSIAGAASQSKNVTQAGGIAFQAAFETSDWSGDVLAYPMVVSASNELSIGTSKYWSASDQLMALTAPATTRNIVVGTKGANPTVKASAFTWDAIEASLKSDLAKVTPSSAADNNAQDRLNYLRGDRSKEGSTFRLRNKLLGDIVNSGVAYSGAPSLSIADANYAQFYTTNKNRVPAIFVGANDGMLHAFNATVNQGDSGKEIFAYIPSWMGPKLAALTSKTYVGNHQSYVDGYSVVAEAKVGTSGGADDWKTVLVGSTGAGGRGIFALDVTNPATFSASNVMWEFTGLNDPDMGYVVGSPQILKFRTNALTAQAATYKWFAVVASGVNNYVSDGNDLSNASGKPTLFLLDLTKAAGAAWQLNTNYFKLSVPVDATIATTVAPGLINFRAALGRFNEVTDIFMGDLHGNLWKATFSKIGYAGTSDWTMEKLSFFQKNVSGSNVPYPLFIAKDASGAIQPITVGPRLFSGEALGATYVAFGTGKYLEAADRGSTATNSFYAVFDSPNENSIDSGATSAIAGRNRLAVGTVNTTTGTVTVPAFVWGRPSSASDTSKRAGYYFDFPTSGERQVSNGQILGDYLVFGSLVPGASGGANSCGADGGSGYEYVLNIDTGATTYRVSTVGILGEPMIATITPATSYTTKDNTGRQTRSTTSRIIQQGSTGLSPSASVTTTVVTGRLSWRQINNYRELKGTASATP